MFINIFACLLEHSCLRVLLHSSLIYAEVFDIYNLNSLHLTAASSFSMISRAFLFNGVDRALNFSSIFVEVCCLLTGVGEVGEGCCWLTGFGEGGEGRERTLVDRSRMLFLYLNRQLNGMELMSLNSKQEFVNDTMYDGVIIPFYQYYKFPVGPVFHMWWTQSFERVVQDVDKWLWYCYCM